MLQNEYLVAIVAVHKAENEPSKVCLYLSSFCLYLVLTQKPHVQQCLAAAHSMPLGKKLVHSLFVTAVADPEAVCLWAHLGKSRLSLGLASL